MLKLIMVVSVVFLMNCHCCERKDDEILSVVAVFRHGDKMPKYEYIKVYPNNPWTNPKLWNHTDFGTVTYMGKVNAYERGKWLRKRYAKFLPEWYSGRHVYIRSSDSDRVLMSAELVLAGLFPPKGHDLWNEKLPWQPIPIHTMPYHNDTVIAQKVPCPKFDKLLNKLLIEESYQIDDVMHLSKYTGKTLTSLEEVYKLYKLLKIVEENGMVLPGWAINAMPILKAKSEMLCKAHTNNIQMQRIKAGPFLYELLAHFEAIINNDFLEPKMLLYAGHSRTVANILRSIDSLEEQPPYTATLLFELKKNCNGSLVVDVYYETGFGQPKEVFKNMPYALFKRKMQLIAVDHATWKKECCVGFVFRKC